MMKNIEYLQMNIEIKSIRYKLNLGVLRKSKDIKFHLNLIFRFKG